MFSGLSWDRTEKLGVGIGLMTAGSGGAVGLVIASASTPEQDWWGKDWFLALFSFLLLMTLVGVVLLCVVLTTPRASASSAAVYPPTVRTLQPLAEPELAAAAIRELEQVRERLATGTLTIDSSELANALSAAHRAIYGLGVRARGSPIYIPQLGSRELVVERVDVVIEQLGRGPG
jgi:hypothetical protein